MIFPCFSSILFPKYGLRWLQIFPTLPLHSCVAATMFAIVDIAGFQEMVKEGDTLCVPRLPEEEGKKVVFGNVLLLSKGGEDVSIGSPYVSGASVEANIVSHDRDEKVRVFRMRRRKRFSRLKGHRQLCTNIEIVKIVG